MSVRFIVYLALLFVIIIIGLFNFKKLSSPYRLLTILVLITFISELLTRYFALVYANSSPVYHIYNPVQYFFITTFFSFFIKKSKTLISWSWVAFMAIVFINILFFQTVWQFSSNLILLYSPVYILLSLLLFKNMLLNINDTPLLKQRLFWYNTSSLFLYLFTFFCWSFYNILLKSNSTRTVINVIYYLAIQYYIVTGIVIYLDSRHNKKIINAG